MPIGAVVFWILAVVTVGSAAVVVLGALILWMAGARLSKKRRVQDMAA